MQTMILSYADQNKRLSSYAPYPTLPSSRPSISSRSQSHTTNSSGKRSFPRLESLPEMESVPFEASKQATVSNERTNTIRISKSSFAVTALLQHDEAIDRFRPSPEQTPRMTNGHLGHVHVQSPNHTVGKHKDEHCLPGTIDQFVEAVQSMNDTVLLPSRLINEVDPLADGTKGQPQDASNGTTAGCSCQCHEPDCERPVEHADNGDVDKYSLFMLLNVVSRQLQRTNLGSKGFSRTSEGHDRQLALLNEPLSRVDERAVAKAKQVCAQITALQKTISELTQAAHQVTNEYHAQTNPDRRK